MTMNGGLFSLSGGTFQVARSSGSTAITINDGTLNHGTAGMFETFANTTTATVAMNGGTLTGAGSYTISRSGGVASLQMSNGYFKNTNNTGVIIVNNTTAGSAGSLLVGGGTFLANTLNVNIGNTGAATLILSQNNVNVPTEMSLGRITQTGGSAYVHFDGGTLTVGSVSVDGPVFQGGTLSPGTAGAAGGGSGFGTTNFTATIAVNYIQGANSHLHLDLGSNPTNDPNTANRDYVHILTVTTGTNHLGETGNATLNGVIDVDITDPVYNTLYTVLTVDAATAGTGGVLTDNSTVVSHTDGWTFNKVYTDGGRTLQLQVIPEPATLGIAGIAFISLLHRRPRRARCRPFATAAA
jgi:hypothetical protein